MYDVLEMEVRIFEYDDLMTMTYANAFEENTCTGDYGTVYEMSVLANNSYGLLEQEGALKLAEDRNGVGTTQLDFEIQLVTKF